MAKGILFDESTLRKLEQLALVAGQVRAGRMKGDRRSKKRGSSIEFADYRNYVKGDDLRRLDWNVYARLERPFIKLLEDEEDLAVHILIDASTSMDWPTVEEDAAVHKLRYAMHLAAALGHIALAAGDQLQVTIARNETLETFGPLRGVGSSLRLFDFMEAHFDGRGLTLLNAFFKDYARRPRRPGLLLILSDFMSNDGYEEGFSALASRGYDPVAIQLLSPDEVIPKFFGDASLVDVETGERIEVTLDPSLQVMYEQRINEWRAEIAASCRRRGGDYVGVTTDLPWEQLILQTLRARGLVK